MKNKNYKNEAIADTNLGKVFSSASVVLGEAPAFKLVFNNDASVNNTFAGKVTVTYGDGNVREYTVNKGQNEACEIVIDGMKIYNFGTMIKVTVTPTEGEATVGTINFATYANYHINVNPADIEVQALIEALYEYVKVAEAYRA